MFISNYLAEPYRTRKLFHHDFFPIVHRFHIFSFFISFNIYNNFFFSTVYILLFINTNIITVNGGMKIVHTNLTILSSVMDNQ